MIGVYKERLRTNIGLFLLVAVLFILTITMMLIAVHFQQLPISKESTDALGVSSYFDGTENEKLLIVLICATFSLLCFVGGFLLICYFKKTYYLRSFNVSGVGIESFFRKETEGEVKYSEVEGTLLLRLPNIGQVGNIAYKSSVDKRWRIIPQRVFKSNILLETIEEHTSKKKIEYNEKAIEANKLVVFDYYAPKNYRKTFSKLFRQINYSLDSKQSQIIKNIIEENLIKMEISASGLKIGDNFMHWENLDVMILRDKADVLPKQRQRKHEYDSICTLKEGDKILFQLQSSCIVNRTAFLHILKNLAKTYSYSER